MSFRTALTGAGSAGWAAGPNAYVVKRTMIAMLNSPILNYHSAEDGLIYTPRVDDKAQVLTKWKIFD